MTEQRVIVDALNIDYPAARVVNNLSFTLATSGWRWWGNPARANQCPPAP